MVLETCMSTFWKEEIDHFPKLTSFWTSDLSFDLYRRRGQQGLLKIREGEDHFDHPDGGNYNGRQFWYHEPNLVLFGQKRLSPVRN